MQFKQHRLHIRNTRNDLLPLDPRHLHGRASEDVERDIGNIVRSVRFELVPQNSALRLLGPDMRYHHVDPHLPNAMKAFGKDMTTSHIHAYKSDGAVFQLCFEDSWSGYFIAAHLRELGAEDDLVLIHLDDHEDMMPTLLALDEGRLLNPTTDAVFSPSKPEDWEDAIQSGCVSIGNFITPLFYSGHRVHVRHLNNGDKNRDELCSVAPEEIEYDYFPGVRFAALKRNRSNGANSAGTYLCGANAKHVLSSLPRGRVVVHIDLDYFINDFNGNPTGHARISDEELHAAARGKLDRFFEALEYTNTLIAGWIVATSPGFCSARHWNFLLGEIETRIQHLRR